MVGSKNYHHTGINLQCFLKVARVADHLNRVADQLRHFARPNDDPQPGATSVQM